MLTRLGKLLGWRSLSILCIVVVLCGGSSFGLQIATADPGPTLSTSGTGAFPIAYNKPGVTGDDLWTFNPSTGGDTFIPIADCGGCPLLGASHPAWSRDGRLMAVTALVQGNAQFQGGYHIAYFDPTNAVATLTMPLYAALGTAFTGWEAFSPDGSKLAYSDIQINFSDYHVIDLRTKVDVDISPGLGELGGFSWGLDWSPTDPNMLVLTQAAFSVAGNMQLVLVPPVYNGACTVLPCPQLPRVLTQPPDNPPFTYYDILPSFSPDGKSVAFARFSTVFGLQSTELRVIGLADGGGQGQPQIQLPTGYIVTGLSWSGDSKNLVFDEVTPAGALLGGGSNGLWTCSVGNCAPTATQIKQPPAFAPAWAGKIPAATATATPSITSTPTATPTPVATATPTASPSGTATPTRTPESIFPCTPRPNVNLSARPGVPGELDATISVSGVGNFILSLQFANPGSNPAVPANAAIDILGNTGITGGSITPPPGTTQVSFAVRRSAAGLATIVPIIVTDRCGPWPTFVGGGPNAF